jgi:hypothetical protein
MVLMLRHHHWQSMLLADQAGCRHPARSKRGLTLLLPLLFTTLLCQCLFFEVDLFSQLLCIALFQL